MRLFDLIGDEGSELAENRALKNVEVTGLTADSRKTQPGNLFAALPGTRHDGRDFIGDALARGAGAVLAPRGTVLPDDAVDVPLIADDEPARRFALMAARFYVAQPDVVTAVTGTNGKTSVASFLRQIWAHGGLAAASLGTLGLSALGRDEPGALTTPDPVMLHRTLAELAGSGISHLVLEASSHGIEQFRLDGVRLQAAAFTNLSRDHLDYHGSEEAYFAAKAQLFSRIRPEGAMAVLNADVPEFMALAAIAEARRQRIISYGVNGEAVRVKRGRAEGLGQLVTFEIAGRTGDVHLPLVGAFQIANVACAIGLFVAAGGEAGAALDAVSELRGAPGRMEHIGDRANGAAVFVDYAHTPDALANALAALRPHTKSELAVVFGCGGDRDRGKRPVMGRIAAEAADRVIVTDDNPRGEDAAAIRREILAGIAARGKVREIADRGEAIRDAISGLGPGDLLVVAGKGHETGQIVGDTVLPFDDRREVADALAAERGAP
ncbi:MAG: UDP-N-acetylmuramoyl-L-alanyl-D-glutamate--2,6-diaminopimelate ligase [Alphaproteobacteria bacterium]|nr:UDP-N-acetylmuramoyl-L-alanyl-D-glutamate--2,6-diaminopimelate ligase [Alphaproteobacteria bacterium]